ncbi:hypothetical protein [Azospirillum halopraeferens]|uniref:hypothetical protein n=1 Tax=Azospirillum halopraeferens TaxID=34010 RepID=UPI00048DDC1E|nr:hypothetical protein [Azospirillum halopraeferens]
MSVGPPGSAGPLGPSAPALAGMQQAQATVAAASEQVAADRLDPAVIVDIANAETAFAANVRVLQAGTDMSKRLLDMLV